MKHLILKHLGHLVVGSLVVLIIILIVMAAYYIRYAGAVIGLLAAAYAFGYMMRTEPPEYL
jgi:hypothetical protein